MTRSASHQTRKMTEEKIQRLLAIIKEVAGIDIKLLCICFHEGKLQSEAREELDKLSNLIQTIQIELEIDKGNVDIDVKDNMDGNDDGGDNDICANDAVDGVDLNQSTALKVKFPSPSKDISSTNHKPFRPSTRRKILNNLSSSTENKTMNASNKDAAVDKNPSIQKKRKKECTKKSQSKQSQPQKYFVEKIKQRNDDYSVENKYQEEEEGIEDKEEEGIEDKGGKNDKYTKGEECNIDNAGENSIQKRYNESNIRCIGVLTTQTPWICERCGKTYSSKKILHDHIKRHNEEDANISYNCTVCDKQFKFKNSFHKHMKYHSSKKEFQCPKCGRCFLEKYGLKKHMETHSGEKPYVCLSCNRSFNRMSNLQRHKKVHTDELWKCMYCERSFRSKESLMDHIETHPDNERPKVRASNLQCSLCSQQFLRYNDFYCHSLCVHSKDLRKYQSADIFECSYCHKHFPRKSTFIQHLRIHTGEKPYQCTYCPMRFKAKQHLVLHTRKHTGVKPYKCAICEKSFAKSQARKVHQAMHMGLDYKCSVCDKAFGYHYNLIRHMGTHSGSKPHKCHICDRSFSQKAALDAHQWTHTSEKRYKCDVCGKGYNDKRNLVSHSKTHNMNQNNQDTSVSHSNHNPSLIEIASNENASLTNNHSTSLSQDHSTSLVISMNQNTLFTPGVSILKLEDSQNNLIHIQEMPKMLDELDVEKKEPF